MAKEVKVKLKVDNTEANEELQETAQEVKKVETGLDDALDSGDALSGGLVSSFRNVKKGILSAIKGLRTLKGALIATGIGAFAVAIGSVVAAFQSSEEGQNSFLRIVEKIGVVVGNVTDIMASFGKSILQVGKWIGAKFKGDAEAAAEAIDGIKKNFNDATEGIKNFREETEKELAVVEKLADAREYADKLERRLIVERARAEATRAELLEKAVNKENFTSKQRLAFLKEAEELDKKTTDAEINLARIRLNNKVEANKLSGSTKEDLMAEAELRAALFQLEQTQLTKQKEVTSQRIALNAEIAAADQKIIDDKTASDQKELDDQAAFALAEREAIAVTEDQKTQLLIEKETERYNALILLADKYGKDTTALVAAREAKINEINEKAKKEDLDNTETTEKVKHNILLQFASLGVGLATEGSNAAKALGIATALISTYSGAAQVLGDKTLPLFAKIAGVATVLATGFTQIRAIQQTKIPVLSIGGTTTNVGSGSAPTLTAPAFNVVGASPISQLADTINNKRQEPVQAYVVANQVTTAQALARNAVRTAGI